MPSACALRSGTCGIQYRRRHAGWLVGDAVGTLQLGGNQSDGDRPCASLRPRAVWPTGIRRGRRRRPKGTGTRPTETSLSPPPSPASDRFCALSSSINVCFDTDMKIFALPALLTMAIISPMSRIRNYCHQQDTRRLFLGRHAIKTSSSERTQQKRSSNMVDGVPQRGPFLRFIRIICCLHKTFIVSNSVCP